MDALQILVNVLEAVLLAYFGFASIYVFVFALAGHF